MVNFKSKTIKDTILEISINNEQKNSFQFFILFSRFEYALKRNLNFLKHRPIKINDATICLADADWNEFSKKNNENFLPTLNSELWIAVEYFKKLPPCRQLVNKSSLTWSEPSNYIESSSLLKWIIDQIKIVRNNLFHGGKFPEKTVSEPSRDQLLMQHAITILTACLDLDVNVKNQFLEGIDE